MLTKELQAFNSYWKRESQGFDFVWFCFFLIIIINDVNPGRLITHQNTPKFLN